jgi:hypothetical protein
MNERSGELAAIARQLFEEMRNCGDEVRELLQECCTMAVRPHVWWVAAKSGRCAQSAMSMYSNRTQTWDSSKFFHCPSLADPARLLQGNGRFMRHVKLKPETAASTSALTSLIEAACADIKARVETCAPIHGKR